MSSSPSTGAVTSADATTYVTQLYENILQRAPDAGGLASWVSALTSGALTEAQVEAAFIASPEAQSGVVPTIELYTAFGRVPDAVGLKSWVTAEDAGSSLASVAAGFLSSSEGTTIYGSSYGVDASSANVAFVTTLYSEILGRATDAAGLAYWTTALTNGTLTGAQVLLAIATSAEATARDSAGITNLLKSAGSATTASSIFTGSGTLASLSGTTSSFALTTGTDAPTIASNEAITGIVDFGGATTAGALSTFNATDTLAGTGTEDVLNLTLQDAGTGTSAVSAEEEKVEYRFYSGTSSDTTYTVTVNGISSSFTVTSGTDAETLRDDFQTALGQLVSSTAVSTSASGSTSENDSTYYYFDVTSAVAGTALPTITFTATEQSTLPEAVLLQSNVVGVAASAALALPDATVSGISTVDLTDNAGAIDVAQTEFTGATALNSEDSTYKITFTSVASGTSVGELGGSAGVEADYVTGATAATINIADGVTGGTITVSGDGLTSATINSTGDANTIGAVSLSTGITALTIDATTSLITGGISDSELATITVTGAASNTTDQGAVYLGTLGAAVKTVNASGLTAGGVDVTLDTDLTSFTGGAGNDIVTTSGSGLGTTTASAVSAGDGTANTLIVAASSDVDTATLAEVYAGFNVLEVGSGDTVDVALFTNSTITSEIVNADSSGNSAELDDLSATQAANITVISSGEYTFGVTGATTPGEIDTLGLTVNDSATTTSSVTLDSLTADGIEIVDLAVTDSHDTAVIGSLTGLASLTTLTLSGAGNASITSGELALNANTTFNASSLDGTLTLDLSSATGNAVSITGAVGANTISLDDVADNVVNLSANVTGGSTVTLDGAEGAQTITLGSHSTTDTIAVGADTDGVYGSSGNETTLGDIIAINDFTISASSGSTDHLSFVAGTPTTLTDGSADASTTGVTDLTATYSSGIVTFAGTAASSASLAKLIYATEQILDSSSTSTVAAFQYGGSTYVVATPSTDASTSTDHVFELSGVTGVTALSTTAAGAHTIYLTS